MLEDVLAIRAVREQIGIDVGEDRLFAHVEADDRRNVGVECLVVGEPRADRIGQRHVAGAVGVEQPGHAEVRVGAERQRIEEVIVDPSIDDVDAPQPCGGPHVDDVVVDEEVAAFDKRHAHLAREERVLEVGGVADAGC